MKEELIGMKAPYPWWIDDPKYGTVDQRKESIMKGIHHAERRYRKKNGDYSWVEINVIPIYHNGELCYSLSTWIDITERKEIEQKQKEEAENQSTEEARVRVEQTKQGWVQQMKEMEEAGILPKVAEGKEGDQSDPGVKARDALFGAMNQYNEEREKQGLGPTFNLWEVNARKYKGGKVAGEDAPVMGGSVKASGESSDLGSYEELRKSGYY